MKKILLYIPTFDGKLSIEFVSRLKTIEVPVWYELDISFSKRTLIDRARNMAVEKTIKWKYEYLFFVDDDTYPNKDVLVKLVWNDLPIVSWVYRARGWDHKLMLRERTLIGGKPYYYNLNKINKAIGVIQHIDAVWAWCLLIKRVVLEDMVKVYWQNLFENTTMVFYKGKEYMFDKPIEDFDKISKLFLSEDITFCERAKSMMYDIKFDSRCNCVHEWVWMDKYMYVDSSDIEVSILVKDTVFPTIQKHLMDKIRSNYEVLFVDDEITKDIIDSTNWDYIMYIDDVEIPYKLEEAMIKSLQECTITWPLIIQNGKWTFRNDNIVTHCWMMKRDDLIQIVPVPTDIKDFTIYRKIKDNKWICAILDATIKING